MVIIEAVFQRRGCLPNHGVRVRYAVKFGISFSYPPHLGQEEVLDWKSRAPMNVPKLSKGGEAEVLSNTGLIRGKLDD